MIAIHPISGTQTERTRFRAVPSVVSRRSSEGWRKAWIVGAGVIGASIAPAAGEEGSAWFRIIEAEDMEIRSGWKVIEGSEGYFPAYPQSWSGNRLKADTGKAAPAYKGKGWFGWLRRRSSAGEEAVAEARVEIPVSGDYALWVRHESSYGFDALFRVEIEQGGHTVWSKWFGDRNDRKYFNGTCRVQGPWAYHNTDYVYSRGEAELSAGSARVRLLRGPDTPFSAARIIDLLCLCDDPDLEPGREMLGWRERPNNITRPPIQSRCLRPAYLRLEVPPESPGPVRASVRYKRWESPGGQGFGPQRVFAFEEDGLTERYSWEKPQNEALETLPPGYDSGWRKVELNTFAPAWASVSLAPDEAVAILSIAHDPDGADAVEFALRGNLPRDLVIGVGNGRSENDLLRGQPAAAFADILQRYVEELDAYRPPGRKAFAFGVSAGGHPLTLDGFDKREFSRAMGASMVYFRCQPEFYSPENAERLGINRSMGYQNAHNAALNRACYEGDYTRLEAGYRRIWESLDAAGLGKIPQNVKMIEERGPPAMGTLRTWPLIVDRFREYAREQGLNPADLLDRTALREAVREGAIAEKALWPRVTLGRGTPAEARENPQLFYHTKQFGSRLFCDNLAEAVKRLETVFPAGTVANSGAFWPQDGHAVRRNWYDEFMLFRRRGMTAWGSELTWGLCGMAHYIGPQSESFEGALARGVAKYHDAVLGPTHLLASGIYGYNADYVETSAFALASHGLTSLHFYDSTQYGTYNIDPEIRKAIKRVSYAMGAVEDRLTRSRVVPARVALGWSETTAIWDQAEPTDPGYNRPGNVMYALERHYLYLLLRHVQLPVDLLCDADLEAGFLGDYDVFVQVGDHIPRKAADALRQWVEAGGILVSVAGGGLRDEYDRPLDTLSEVYGIRGQRYYAEQQDVEYVPGAVYEENPRDNRLEKRAQALRAKLELIHAHPVDAIRLSDTNSAGMAKMPVLGYRQGFTVEKGQVLGTFDNGQAAVVMNDYGQGRALVLGFLPGIGSMYRAFPAIPYGRGGEDLSLSLYPDFHPVVVEGFSRLLRRAWPEMGASVTCSDPLVEANLLRQEDGTFHVALVNFSDRPIPDLAVRIRSADVGRARTARATFGEAAVQAQGPELLVTLPLRKFEWLTLQ